MRIGIDFDNTIVCYDGVFHLAAKEHFSLPDRIGQSKDAIRDYFRSIGEEPLWTELQGHVYGTQMHLAKPFPHVEDFFQQAKTSLFIISHKTLHPYKGPKHNLHLAAQNWLKNHPFSENTPAFFELTLGEKLDRIEKIGCDWFIDDLPELLLEPTFPQGVQKILFDPNQNHAEDPRYLKFSSWKDLTDYFWHKHG